MDLSSGGLQRAGSQKEDEIYRKQEVGVWAQGQNWWDIHSTALPWVVVAGAEELPCVPV